MILIADRSSNKFASESNIAFCCGASGRSDAELSLPTTFFINSIAPLLRRSAGAYEIKAAIVAALDDDQKKLGFFEHLAAAWPSNFGDEVQKVLVDLAVEEAGNSNDSLLPWRALKSALVHLAKDRSDFGPYNYLAHKLSSLQLPPDFLTESAKVFSGISCFGKIAANNLSAWVNLFDQKGSEQTYQIFCDELINQLKAGNLSGYSHIVKALYSGKNNLASFELFRLASQIAPAETLPAPLAVKATVLVAAFLSLTTLAPQLVSSELALPLSIVLLSAIAAHLLINVDKHHMRLVNSMNLRTFTEAARTALLEEIHDELSNESPLGPVLAELKATIAKRLNLTRQ